PFNRVAAQAAVVDAAFQHFWSASAPREATAAVDAIVQSGVTFDEAYARLKRGRTYGPRPTGFLEMSSETDDHAPRRFALVVPDNYNPARKYQVRFQLHGGVTARG